MKPNVFMDEFERTEWADAHYAAIGRALTFASRFEAISKSLSALVGLKKDRSFLDSEQRLASFTEQLRRMPLARHLSALSFEVDSIGSILSEAREARNDIAHELTLGLDRCLDSLPEESLTYLSDRLEILSTRMAEGDRIVSYLVSVITNEEIPSRAFLEKYSRTVAEWVCDR